MSTRVPIWQKRTTTTQRWGRYLRRIGFGGAAVIAVYLCLRAYQQDWWPSLLDWAVVAIPAVAGLVAWVMPDTAPNQISSGVAIY
jgi:hypothetical protein